MITELLLDLVVLIFEAIRFLIPDVAVDFLDPIVTYIATTISGFAGVLDQWVPIGDVFEASTWVLATLVPFVIVYKLVFWIFQRIPVIGS